MFNSYMFYDVLGYGRKPVMDFHIEDNLFSDCITSFGCLLDIISLGIGVILIAWGTSFMIATWRDFLTWIIPCLGG
jgi:hypothetical protein